MAYWAATQTQAHRERVAERFLKQFGFEVYLPRVWQRWHRFGRSINVRQTLFSWLLLHQDRTAMAWREAVPRRQVLAIVNKQQIFPHVSQVPSGEIGSNNTDG